MLNFFLFFSILIGIITSPTFWASKRAELMSISRHTGCTAVVPACDHTKLHRHSSEASLFLPNCPPDWLPFNQIRDIKILLGPKPVLSLQVTFYASSVSSSTGAQGGQGADSGISPAAWKGIAVLRAGPSCHRAAANAWPTGQRKIPGALLLLF